MDIEDTGHQTGQEAEECDEVVDGIKHSLSIGKGDVQSEPISYFRSVPENELDVPGLEVPEKED